MGFISVLVINNDHMGFIDKDPEGWWEAARLALADTRSNDGVFGFKGSVNGYQAAWCQHADVTALFLLKFNMHPLITGRWHKDTDDEALLLMKGLADKMGYRLVRKPGKGERKKKGTSNT